MNNIKEYSYEELIALIKDLGQPKFRADQLVQWLYQQGATSYQEMTNLPKPLRETLEKDFPLKPAEIVDRRISKDGTRKYILEFADGARVETVAIPSKFSPAFSPLQHDEANTESLSSFQKLTVCVSTQAGCPMECLFCATGKERLTRNLLPGEIIEQVLIAQKDMGFRVNNVVTMGQGEPFLNYQNTLAALRMINSPKGLEIGARHITISTCGILSGIKNLENEPEQFTLAVSLHSAEQTVRNYLMPQVANFPLTSLKKTLLDYVAKTNRRVSLEYILINGITDTKEALKSLESFCEGLLCHVNLLPINSIGDSLDEGGPLSVKNKKRNNKGNLLFSPSSPKTVKHWLVQLEKSRIPATLRNSRGSDIAGACGQLKNSFEKTRGNKMVNKSVSRETLESL